MYNPQNSTSMDDGIWPPTVPKTHKSSNRNLLIAQVVAAPASKNTNPGVVRAELWQFAELSSRPNRAYARQWGRNYVRYTAPDNDSNNSNHKNQNCDGFHHVVVLNSILDRQPPRSDDADTDSNTLSYDALVLLPPDAIITDLDYDLLSMIPKDKLVATVNSQQTTGGIVFWNLDHELTHTVALALWNKLVEPEREEDEEHARASCNRKGSYMDLLLKEILPTLLDKGEEVKSVVGGLGETLDGFVFAETMTISSSDSEVDAMGAVSTPPPTNYCLKCFPPSSSSSSSRSSKTSLLLSHPDATRMTLQRTADAVCYRYYPKCEVL